MRFISLFSGVGGFDLGFERAGMECVAQVEFNKQAATVLKHRWPNVKHFEDVRHVGKHNLPAADLICGGFPCQDVSVAGRRAGLAGERSGLWFEFLRIITECTPGWVVIENVPGLLTSNRGRDFATIVHGLVKCGYRVGWRVLDAQYDGLAQRRKRVFVVASLATAGANPAQVLFERESSAWDTPPSRETRQGTATYAIKGAAIGRKPENGPQYGEISADGASYTLNTSEVHAVAGTLAASGAGMARPAGQANEADFLIPTTAAVDVRGLKLGNEISGTLQSKNTGGWSLNYINPVLTTIDTTGHQGDRVVMPDGVWPTLSAESCNNGGGANALAFAPIAYNYQRFGEYKQNDTGSTLRAQAGGMAYDLIDQLAVRRLTPIECERLQGFPDNWTLVNNAADGVRYRQLGNAIAVPVAYWIGKRIMDAIPKAIVLWRPQAA
jgi:DNA (cytosine-5)-methyltransferase 1